MCTVSSRESTDDTCTATLPERWPECLAPWARQHPAVGSVSEVCPRLQMLSPRGPPSECAGGSPATPRTGSLRVTELTKNKARLSPESVKGAQTQPEGMGRSTLVTHNSCSVCVCVRDITAKGSEGGGVSAETSVSGRLARWFVLKPGGSPAHTHLGPSAAKPHGKELQTHVGAARSPGPLQG